MEEVPDQQGESQKPPSWKEPEIVNISAVPNSPPPSQQFMPVGQQFIPAGQQFVPVSHQYVVQKNQTAVVIGWLVVVYGGLMILLTPLNFLPVYDIDGSLVELPYAYKMSASILNLIIASLSIIGGYRITKYEKVGIWIVMGSLALSFMGGIFLAGMFPDSISSVAITEQESLALTAIFSLFCNGICAGFVAIPLLVSNNGLE